MGVTQRVVGVTLWAVGVTQQAVGLKLDLAVVKRLSKANSIQTGFGKTKISWFA